MTSTGAPPRRLLRSTGAVLLGFISMVVLSLGTDQVLHVLQVYPPWGQPMYDPRLNLLALWVTRCLPLSWLGGVLYVKTTTRSDRKIG